MSVTAGDTTQRLELPGMRSDVTVPQPARLDAVAVSAWFGDTKVLERVTLAMPPSTIRRGNNGELWMVDGGPNRRWLSFDPKYEKFSAFNLPATRSGNATDRKSVV